MLSTSSGLITALLAAMLWAGPGLSQEPRGQGPASAATNPASAARYYERGLEDAKKGEEAQAVDDIKRAIELDPSRFEPYKSLDDLLSKKGDWDTIIAYWTKFLALQPNDARAYHERGGTFTHTRDYVRAWQDYKKACSLGDQSACQLADRCAQLLAARDRAATQQASQEDQGLLVTLARIVIDVLLVAVPLAIPVLIIVWLVGVRRSRRRTAARPASVSVPRPESAASSWQLPAELASPAPRSVQANARVVLTCASIPLILVGGYWILLGDSKLAHTLATELAQHRFDARGVIGLLLVAVLLWFPLSFATRVVLTLAKSRTLLRDGRAAGGTVTSISRSRRGPGVYYTFTTDGGMAMNGRYRPLLVAPIKSLRVGQSVTVLYNPEDPEQNTLYPAEAFKLAA